MKKKKNAQMQFKRDQLKVNANYECTFFLLLYSFILLLGVGDVVFMCARPSQGLRCECINVFEGLKCNGKCSK